VVEGLRARESGIAVRVEDPLDKVPRVITQVRLLVAREVELTLPQRANPLCESGMHAGCGTTPKLQGDDIPNMMMIPYVMPY